MGENDPARKHKLINDVTTRWNSTLDMLERLAEQTAPIHALVQDPSIKLKDVRASLYNFFEQAVVEGMIHTLTPFKRVTVILSADTTPTLSMVSPTLQMLRKAIAIPDEPETAVVEGEDDDADLSRAKKVIQIMKKRMSQELDKRFENMEMYELASMLDPRTKGMMCALKGRETVKEKLVAVAMTDEAVLNVEQRDAEPNLPNPLPALPALQIKQEPEEHIEQQAIKKIKLEDHSDWLDEVLFVREERNAMPVENLTREVEMFLGCNFEKGKADVMKWWAAREKMFPTLAMCAKKYLCVPASSVPSERVFSLAGNIVSKKRACLKPENVDMLIFP